MDALIKSLVQIAGETGVLTAAADLDAFVTDCRGSYKGDAKCLVRPRSTEEVAAVVALCTVHSVPIQPQGGNTGLTGASVPYPGEGSVILSLSRMHRVREIDATNNSMTVEAGCVLADVQRAAIEAGRYYPVSLGAEGSCQIGGNIATNAGGTGVLRYGNTRENVLGLEVVLPDATIWHGLRGLRKNNTGFDLKHLFIGSEGLLGIITAATLKLHPLNTHNISTWLAPAGIDAAVELLGVFQAELGPQLSAFETMNGPQLQMVLKFMSNPPSPLDPNLPWHILAEFNCASNEAGLRNSVEQILQTAFSRGLVTDAVIAASEAQRTSMWDLRHNVTDAIKAAGRGISHDIAVPVSKIPEFLRRITPALEQRFAGVQIIIVGHLGDGNLHFVPVFTNAAWAAFPDPDAVIDEVHQLTYGVVNELGGTFSAEHGIGRYLLGEMRQYKSETELSLMRSIKHTLDPKGLFNPGKVIPQALN